MKPETPSSFTLRRLELAMPFVKQMKEEDTHAMVSVAAIVLADEETLKLYAAGNTKALETFADKVYAMPPFEVAALLAGFTRDSARFSSLLSGLSPEVLDKMEAKRKAKIEAALLPDESASQSVVIKQH